MSSNWRKRKCLLFVGKSNWNGKEEPHSPPVLFHELSSSQWKKPRTAMGGRERGLVSQDTFLADSSRLIFSKVEFSNWKERKTISLGISKILFKQTSSLVLRRKQHTLTFPPQLAPQLFSLLFRSNTAHLGAFPTWWGLCGYLFSWKNFIFIHLQHCCHLLIYLHNLNHSWE